VRMRIENIQSLFHGWIGGLQGIWVSEEDKMLTTGILGLALLDG